MDRFFLSDRSNRMLERERGRGRGGEIDIWRGTGR